MIQKGLAGQEGEVILAIVTHEGPESAVCEAMRVLEGSQSLTAAPLVMQIIEG